MALTKKSPSASKARSSSSNNAISLKKVKGENFYRDAKQVARLKMYNGGKAVRDKDGKIIQAAAFQKTEAETKPGRVQPDKRWFGNTRVITQKALDHFRTSLAGKSHDPYSVLLRRNKLPMALLDEAKNPHTQKRSHIVETEPFRETFGPKAQRKRPRLDVGTFEELSQLGKQAEESTPGASGSQIEKSGDSASPDAFAQTHADYIEPIYSKGTSRRIYGELYKVIDSSDVILHILDARDPLGTMCESVLEYIRKEKAHKQVVLVINKCDLVPNWVTARYIQHLTPRYPTIAFHASPRHSFGKGSLIQLLRQFSQLHSDRKQISVGFVGYPNVGKSSVINTLKSNKVCTVAPIPGETKVWQYITLTRRIYLIDCPGIVPTSAHDSQTATVLKGVVRIEALPAPSEHIPELLKRVKPVYLSRTYNVPLPSTDFSESEESDPKASSSKRQTTWDAEVLLDTLARMKGRLLKGGEPDREGIAKILLSDWVRGRIPFFVPPPERPEDLNDREKKEREKIAKGGVVDERVKKREGKGKEKEKADLVVDGSGEASAEEEVHITSGGDGETKKAPKGTIGVTQRLRGIMQKNKFVAEDIQPLEDPAEQDVDEADEESDASSFHGFGDDNDADDGSEEEMTWNDVFDGDVQDPAPAAAEAQSEPEEEEEDRRHRGLKDPRMKTNKKKATNYFSAVNVKNKNRSRKSLKPGREGKRR